MSITAATAEAPLTLPPALEVQHLHYAYLRGREKVEALSDLSCRLDRGRSVAVVGPSGCGKTTLLYLLAGLTFPQKGRILVDGQPLTGPRRETAFILQDHGLLPWKTARQNVALGLELRRVPKQDMTEQVDTTLDLLGLTEYQHHYPAQLSGGQRQRVAIGRALALRPNLLLMDEPFSALDALTREELQETLLMMWSQRPNLSIMLVTHSIEEAVFLGQEVWLLSPRPARIVARFDNPGAGDPTYRSSNSYHQLCNELRFELGSIMRGKATGQ